MTSATEAATIAGREDGLLGRRSVGSELLALAAVARKDWAIYRRYPGRLANIFIWPVLFPLGFILSARALGGPDGSSLPHFEAVAGTGDYVGFLAIGSTFYMWLNVTLWSVGFSLREEQLRGTLESNWLCPVWRASIILGAAVARLGLALVFLAVTAAEFWLFFGIRVVPANWGLAGAVVLLTIPSIYGIGIGFGSLVLRFKEFNPLVVLVRSLFLVFCGTTYPLAVLPEWMQAVAAWLPLTYTIRALRALDLPGATLADVAVDLQRLALFAVALPLLGFLAFRSTERRSRQSGSLGHY